MKSSDERRRKLLRKKFGAKLSAKGWNEFQDVTTDERTQAQQRRTPGFKPDKVYANNQYIVFVFFFKKQLGQDVTKLMIQRSDSKPVHNWEDLQRIKNELFGEEVQAFEMYPKQSELINTHNIYWLWVIDET